MPTRVIKSEPGAMAGIVVAKNVVRINVNKDNGILVDEKGTTITGPISFVAGPDQIRVGALWTMQSAMRGSLPSTLATPTAMYNIDPPIRQVAGIMKDAAVMIALVGALSAIPALG